MFRIRFHGRGGQGIKTAARILGTAFFREGFEVQDAPRYGAERRGAPIFAYVRADRRPINARGVIRRPDLVVVADDTLLLVSAGEILAGVDPRTALLIASPQTSQVWRERLQFAGRVLTLPEAAEPKDLVEVRVIGAAAAGAAARLVGVISQEALAQAIREELASLGEAVVAKNLRHALTAYDLMADQAGCVTEAQEMPADTWDQPRWIDLPFEDAGISAPAILAPATSEKSRTGLWRTVRPVLDYQRCRRCVWICGTLCPDSTISPDADGYPRIDYEHCKGCLICLASCPAHAIRAVPESEAAAAAAAVPNGPLAHP